MTKKIRNFAFASGLLFASSALLTSGSALAQSAPPVSGDALSANTPMLDYLRNKAHARMTSLGELAGPGHECVVFDFNGKRNAGCLMPDGQHAIIGIVIDANGKNVTLDAIAHEELRLANAMKQAGALATQSRQQGDILGENPMAAANTSGAMDQSHEPLKTDANDVSSIRLPGAGIATPVKPIAPGQDPRWITKLTSDDLNNDVSATGSFVIGKSSAPQVVLVADPLCPFCHRAWAQLLPYIDAGKISVVVILVATPNLHSDDQTTSLLANQNVSQAWRNGEGSKDGVKITSTAGYNSDDWKTAQKVLPFNRKFYDKYVSLLGTPDKQGVPIMMYVGKDKKTVYGREGVSTPEDMESFLGGL